MRYIATLLALSLVACGGDSTGPDPAPQVSGLVITGGNFQRDTVTHRLPNDLAIQAVTNGGQPAGGVLVCWVAATEGAGEPFVPCAETDSNGAVETPWTLGTVARTDHVAEGRAIVDGEPVVVATYELEAVPGEADPDFMRFCFSSRTHESPVTLREDLVPDVHGNVIPYSIVPADSLVVQGDSAGSEEARTVEWDPENIMEREAFTDLVRSGGEVIATFGYIIRTTTNGPAFECRAFGLDR